MTTLQFVLNVQVKLNRLDSSNYQDVRPEEIRFFGNKALKNLTLGLDRGLYSNLTDVPVINRYLSDITRTGTFDPIVDNKVAFTDENILKLKDVKAFVTVEETSEEGWMPTRELDNSYNSRKDNNPFRKSYPDRPSYRLINSELVFNVDGFTVTKLLYDYLLFIPLTSPGTITYPFNDELEDKTVTLILENLESRRIGSQPAVSKL